jgi:hypothetical protein
MLLKRLITTLEVDSHIGGGLSRSATTVHFDTDDGDLTNLLRDLRRNFGLLRAFKRDSRGSRLLQLCDLLLGISTSLSRAGTFSTSSLITVCGQRKQELIAWARSEAKHFSVRGKINAVLELTPEGLRYLLEEQGG